MIHPENIPDVSPDEALARYVMHSSHIRRSNQTVKADVFMPHADKHIADNTFSLGNHGDGDHLSANHLSAQHFPASSPGELHQQESRKDKEVVSDQFLYSRGSPRGRTALRISSSIGRVPCSSHQRRMYDQSKALSCTAITPAMSSRSLSRNHRSLVMITSSGLGRETLRPSNATDRRRWNRS